MDFLQTLRRIGQQSNGWQKAAESQSAQLSIITKFYLKNGLEIKLTCGACPEQYDIFKDGTLVAYYRLRHGEFRVDYPNCMGETIFEASPKGDGIFDDDERIGYLTKAMREVLKKIKKELTVS
jgi:hypothetical protein